MKCPVDQAALVMSERQGVEIDYCPECRGVWLDRGELDKVIERSEAPTPSREHTTPRVDTRPHRDERYSNKDDYRHNDHYKKKKKENFLGELFDF